MNIIRVHSTNERKRMLFTILFITNTIFLDLWGANIMYTRKLKFDLFQFLQQVSQESTIPLSVQYYLGLSRHLQPGTLWHGANGSFLCIYCTSVRVPCLRRCCDYVYAFLFQRHLQLKVMRFLPPSLTSPTKAFHNATCFVGSPRGWNLCCLGTER